MRTARTIAAMAASLLLVACGGSDAAPTTTEAPAAPQAQAAVIQETSPVAITGSPLPQLPESGSDAAVGTAAPVVAGESFDGSNVTIGGTADGPTLLVFLAHWCPHCNDEIPELNELRDSGALPAELDVVGVSTAVAPDRDNYPPSNWVVEKDWTWPVLADSEPSDAFVTYGGSGFPFSVMLAPDGTVLARKAGSSSAAQIDAWIDEALDQTN